MSYRANAQAPRRSEGGGGPLPWPRWPTAVVIVGALLTATGAVLALLASGEHLNKAGHDYADYFATRNLAIAALLLVLLAARARRVLIVVMLLTASIQLLDVVSASLTGQAGLIPIDLCYADRVPARRGTSRGDAASAASAGRPGRSRGCGRRANTVAVVMQPLVVHDQAARTAIQVLLYSWLAAEIVLQLRARTAATQPRPPDSYHSSGSTA